LIEQGLTSAPTQYRLCGRRFFTAESVHGWAARALTHRCTTTTIGFWQQRRSNYTVLHASGGSKGWPGAGACEYCAQSL